MAGANPAPSASTSISVSTSATPASAAPQPLPPLRSRRRRRQRRRQQQQQRPTAEVGETQAEPGQAEHKQGAPRAVAGDETEQQQAAAWERRTQRLAVKQAALREREQVVQLAEHKVAEAQKELERQAAELKKHEADGAHKLAVHEEELAEQLQALDAARTEARAERALLATERLLLEAQRRSLLVHGWLGPQRARTAARQRTARDAALARTRRAPTKSGKSKSASSSSSSSKLAPAARYRWEFALGNGSYSACDDDMSQFLEQQYARRPRPSVPVDFYSPKRSYTYSLDLAKLTQTNKNTSAVRPIRRVPLLAPASSSSSSSSSSSPSLSSSASAAPAVGAAASAAALDDEEDEDMDTLDLDFSAFEDENESKSGGGTKSGASDEDDEDEDDAEDEEATVDSKDESKGERKRRKDASSAQAGPAERLLRRRALDPLMFAGEAHAPRLVDVSTDSREFRAVERLLRHSKTATPNASGQSSLADAHGRTLKVVHLQRVECPAAAALYATQRMFMAEPGEQLAFHGTRGAAPRDVALDGLDPRRGAASGYLGAGSYGVKDALYAHHYAHRDAARNLYALLLVRLLAGRRHAATRYTENLPPPNFDSVGGVIDGSDVTAVYLRTQSYVSHLIWYSI